MKAGEYEVPDDLLYTKEHEWAKKQGDNMLVGITDYAAKLLNEIVYVSLPTLGSEVKQMDILGSVESIKSVSEIYSPFSGKVVEINEELSVHPEFLNQSPYSEGWIVELAPVDAENEARLLLSAEKYALLLSQLTAKKTS